MTRIKVQLLSSILYLQDRVVLVMNAFSSISQAWYGIQPLPGLIPYHNHFCDVIYVYHGMVSCCTCLPLLDY